jgi:hypothetical protein
MADADPFAQYVAPEPASAAPQEADPFAQYVAPDAPAAAPPSIAQPSRWQRAKAALGAAGRAVVQPFRDFGAGVADTALRANDAVVGAISHPVDTARAIAANPGAAIREGMRGVNDNIPFAARAVSALPYGPPADSPEDSAAFPNARAVGNVAGLPVAEMAGGLAAKSVGALGEKASAIISKRAETGVYRDLGRSASAPGKAKLMDVGPEAIGKVDREFGIMKSPNPPAAIKAARTQVAAARDQAFQQISAAGGDVDMGAVARKLDDLQADFGGKAATRPFAQDVAKLRGELLQRYGSTGEVSAKALADEISAISEGAYGSNYANPKTAQIVQRRTAGALRDVQNSNLDAVAQLGPDEAAAVQAARDANAKFAALKTMEPSVKAKAAKAAFAPGFTDRMIDAPIKTALHTAKDLAGAAASRAVSGGARAAAELNAPAAARVATEWGSAGADQPTVNPAKVAALIQFARTGATREQLHAQAEQTGVPVEIADNIAQQRGL